MEDNLLGEQVVGKKVVNDKWVLDDNTISILKMMYPGFRLIKGAFDLYPNEPFIYIGDDKYINSVKNKPNPHIIVSTTGINLLDRNILLDYVYSFLGKTKPKYLDDLVSFWDDDTFYYNLKFILLLGSVQDKEIQRNSLFLGIISNFSNPIELLTTYFRLLSMGDTKDAFKYLESNLISFIDKCNNMDDLNTKNRFMFEVRSKFVTSYSKNVSNAVYNLLDSSVDSQELKLLNFILDIIGTIKHE